MSFPLVPLVATTLVQTLATMAAYSLPPAAPEIARDLGVDGARIGLFVSLVYGVGMLSALLSSGFVHRFGAIRVSQFILLATIAMLLAASLGGSVIAIGLAGVLLGLGYGATAPSSSHVLIKRTPRELHNLVFSIRQIGVPLGGVLAGLVVPPLVLGLDWRWALGLQILPALVLLALLQIIRSEFDADREPARPLWRGSALAPLRLLKEVPALRPLALAVFAYAGAQLCFVAFMAVHLTGTVGLDLIRAGQALAVFQVAGVVSRPIWGRIADKFVSARLLLACHGLVMAGAALAAGMFGPEWPTLAILLVAAVAGATASGFTGIAFAEFATLGGSARAAETSGLGAFAMFFGVMVMPAAYSFVVAGGAGYDIAYGGVAVLTGLAGLLLLPGARLRPGE